MEDQHCTQRWALQFSFLQRRLDYPEGDQTRSEKARVADLCAQEFNLAPYPSGPLCTTSIICICTILDGLPGFLEISPFMVSSSRRPALQQGQGDRVTKQCLFL